MVDGLINKPIVVIICLFVFLLSCERDKGGKIIVETSKDGTYILNSLDSIKLFMSINKNGGIKLLTYFDEKGLRCGDSYEYYDNGVLKTKSQWIRDVQVGEEKIYDEAGDLIWFYNYKDGMKDGLMYEFEKNGDLKQHKILKSDKTVYAGIYNEGKKYLDIIYPEYISETTIDSIYTAIIKIPMQYKGTMKVLLRDTLDFEKEHIDKNTFKLSIKNAENLRSYDIRFVYSPSENDTLVKSEYTYEHSVKSNN